MKLIKKIILTLLLFTSLSNGAVYSPKCPDWSYKTPYTIGSCVSDENKNYIAHVYIGAYQSPSYGNQWDECLPGECESQFLTCDDSSIVNDTVHIIKYDTTRFDVSVYDTININVFDTTKWTINVYDTIHQNINSYDTTIINVGIYDTTRFDVSIYDTTKFVINKYDTLNISIYDTTTFNINQYDTINVVVNKYDTINIIINEYDTITNIVNKYDTMHVNINAYDTIINVVNTYDTLNTLVNIYDTLFHSIDVYDTITINDTLFKLDTTQFSVLDSIYVNNKTFTVSNIIKEELETTPILVTKIDTNIFNLGLGDTVIFKYDLYVYDNGGQFVNRVNGYDILFDGYKFKESRIKLINADERGYLISQSGKKLGNGVYIIRGNGVVKVNEKNTSNYFYKSLEGYRRKY